MTLEQARDSLRKMEAEGQWWSPDSGKTHWTVPLKAMADAIDAHLAQPAQAVDVEKVAAVGYEAWMDDPGLWLHANNMERSRWTKIAQAIITRALSGEKAGPVGDGLRFPEWVIESLGVLDAETQRLYLDPTDGNKVGLNERCAITFFKRFATDPEEACRMYGTLTASPTPDKEGA
ncbi:hypothetical protein [Frateuria sp.]|uniref:hypothetical protein n=1 Tax=Frateuria sp. TaxID=2211372 RepID=UPI003F7DE745